MKKKILNVALPPGASVIYCGDPYPPGGIAFQEAADQTRMNAHPLQRMLMGLERWQCPKCGEQPPDLDSSGSWRWNGKGWEHYHGYPLGHVPADKAPAQAPDQEPTE